MSDATRVDRIALLERLRAGVAAAQQSEMVAFGRSQVAAHLKDVAVDRPRVGRGIADQIALACRVSPHTGSHRVGVARALHADLPATRGLLRDGEISEELVERVVSETSHLDPELRRAVDARLAAAGPGSMSPKQAAATARRFAYEADRAGYTERARTARKDRRVTLRPAPDTMSVLSGLLPVEQGVACLAALRAHADSAIAAGDERSRDQIQADTLVERVTGQARAQDVNVEVSVVVPVEALLDPEEARADGPTIPVPRASDDPAGVGAGTAELVGHGPLPLGIVRDLLADTSGHRWWRRLFTRPAAVSGESVLIGGDPRRRQPTEHADRGFLATLIGLRDGGRCRDPYCDAPIRHTDHIRQSCDRGPTSDEGSTPIGDAAPARGATTSARCPAGASRPSTTGSATVPTPSVPPRPPATSTTTVPGRDPRRRPPLRILRSRPCVARGSLADMAQAGTTEQRSLAHWAEEGRAGMEAFYALAVEDYRQMVAARDWAADLRRHAVDGRVRALDVACGSGKFPAELLRQGLGDALGDLRVQVDLLDPSPFSIGEARSVLRAPLVAGAEHELRVQDLAPDVGGFDAAWATHALYAVPPAEIGAAAARMHACLRPGGFGAVVHATTASHYLRFAEAFRATFAPDAVAFTSAEEVTAALTAAGAAPSTTTIRYEVAHHDPAVVEGFLQRCVFDDAVSLSRMEAEGPVGDYLAGCRSGGDYRFVQEVDVIVWEAAA